MRVHTERLMVWALDIFIQVLWRIDAKAAKSALGILTKYVPPNERYLAILHDLGILNYETNRATGEFHFLTQYLGRMPFALVMDVGANKGSYSKLLFEIAPNITVHAFEPHPVTFLTLEKMNAINFFAHSLALGDEQKTILLFDYKDEDGSEHASVYSGVFSDIHKKPVRAHEVRCETIDRVAESLGINEIDLLKIDTEGHELAVLKGAKTLIAAGKIKVIQFEFNEMNVISRTFFKDYLDLLSEYKFYRLLPDGALALASYAPVFHEIFAFQNIICIHKGFEFSFGEQPGINQRA